MTIHRIGKNPKAAPSTPASRAWPTGMEYATTATTTETASDTSAAFQAVIRSTPSRTNRVMRGSMATIAVRVSDPATASRCVRYMGYLVVVWNSFLKGGLTCYLAEGLSWLGLTWGRHRGCRRRGSGSRRRAH